MSRIFFWVKELKKENTTESKTVLMINLWRIACETKALFNEQKMRARNTRFVIASIGGISADAEA